MERAKRQMTITSVRKITSGKSTKDGKTFDWALSEVGAESTGTGKSGTFTTFDNFFGREGQDMEVEIWQEEYKGEMQWRIALPKRKIWDVIQELEKRVEALESFMGDSEAQKAGEEIDSPF